MKRKVLIPVLGLFLVLVFVGLGLQFSAGAVTPPPAGQVPLYTYSSFQGLGGATGPYFQNAARAVSSDGTTVVGASGDHGFIWKETTGMVLLPEVPLPWAGSDACAVSEDGTIAAGSVEDVGRPACRWTLDNGEWVLQVLGDLAGGGYGSNFYAMSSDGKVLTGFVNFASYTEAARWTLTEQGWVIEYLGDLPGGNFNSTACGCSVDGSVVVGCGQVGPNISLTRAFRWTASTGMVDLGVIGKRKWSVAYGCSSDGSVVVGLTDGDFQRDQVAFRWTQSRGMVSLGLLPNTLTSAARAVSADGTIVVGRCSARKNVNKAFIWDGANGMRSVQDVLAAHGVSLPKGWSLLEAYGVATPEPGVVVVVGKGFNSQGYTEAWRAVIGQ